jgi:ATP-dependent Clp protease adaptor protein ClpS
VGMDQVAPDIQKQAKSIPQTSGEPFYRVIIHNDDITPMDFVLHVLMEIFQLAGPRAVQVMYTAHFHNSAYVQTLPKNEAQQRVHRAHLMAQLSGYPLKFTLEPEA